MKYEEVTRLGHWFAERIAECVAQELDEWSADAVVPVPLHRAAAAGDGAITRRN